VNNNATNAAAREKKPAMILPARDELTTTSHVDFGRHYEGSGALSYFLRKRLHLAQRLLGQPDRLLEVGYGSGVFLPTLALHCRELHALDVHDAHGDVERMLVRADVTARLHQGSVEHTGLPESFFDAIVAISVLEFVEDLERACLEIKRILRPGGNFVVVTPGYSWVVDLGWRMMSGHWPRVAFGQRRQRIRPTLLAHFDVTKHLRYPAWCLPSHAAYDAYALTPKTR
jgi:SAM-dependent methyltransferase